MGQRLKTIFLIISSSLSVVLFTVLLFALRRGKTNGRGSESDYERNRRIEEGIGKCEAGVDSITERLGGAQDSVTKCEERLRRAENILREAISRSSNERTEP